MPTTVKIDIENKLVWESYTGNIFLNDIVEFKKKHFEDKIHSPNSFIILDLRKAKVNMSEDDVFQLLSFTKRYKHQFIGSKMAILIQQPLHAVISHYFQNVNHKIDHGLMIEMFSTTEAMFRWFGISEK